jgi:DICT domain-containing protein
MAELTDRHLLLAVLYTTLKLDRKITDMAISQEQFDTDLAGFLAAVTTYVAASQAALKAAGSPDLTNEDSEVSTALAALQTASSQIPVAPGVTPPVVVPPATPGS